MEAVGNPRPLAHPLVPRVDEELEILGDPGHRNRAEARLAKGHSSDREGIARVALAGTAQVAALAIGEDRWYLDDPLARGHQQPRQGRAERARALDPETPLRAPPSRAGHAIRGVTPAGFGQRSRMSAAHARAYACHRVGSRSRSVGPTLSSVRARVVPMRVRIAVGFINRNDPAQAPPWSPSGSAATLRGWLAWSGRSRRPPNRVPRASARQGGVAVLGRMLT